MLILQNISYTHSNKSLLFHHISFTLHKAEKVALCGNNGAGKSTLLKIIAGELQPASGNISSDSKTYYVPQVFGQFNNLTVAQALNVNEKLKALQEILDGNVTDANLTLLDDDWAIAERCQEALAHWELTDINLNQSMGTLSGGQKQKVFLTGISIHQPGIVLLDEPSNHLDKAGQKLLHELIRSSSATMIVVSHDRTLLNMLNRIYELSRQEITAYGGNYDFYREIKLAESQALSSELKNKASELRKAKEIERETIERRQRLDSRGKKKQEKAGIPTIMMNTLKNSAEKSTSKLKETHSEKIGAISHELLELRKELPDFDKMKLHFDLSHLHKGKMMVIADQLNCKFNNFPLWKEDLNFRITSGERIAIKGLNGSGKTTLIRIILGELEPTSGSVYKAFCKAVYIDQEYSLIDSSLTVFEQAQTYNTSGLQEYEVNTRLNRFLFTKDFWDKPCEGLSGGEKMRLSLCCLTLSNQPPDLLILDEPTNNQDIQNTEILTHAIKEYSGTLIVVSHDEYFLQQIHMERTIELK